MRLVTVAHSNKYKSLACTANYTEIHEQQQMEKEKKKTYEYTSEGWERKGAFAGRAHVHIQNKKYRIK